MPRDSYRYINFLKKYTQGIPPLKRRNRKGVTRTDLEKAKEFSGQFTDVFNKNEHTQVPFLDRSAPFIDEIVVSKDGVIKLLNLLFILVGWGRSLFRLLLGPPGFNCWFSFAAEFQ